VKSFLQFLAFVLVLTMALAGLYAWKSGQLGGEAAPAPAEKHALPTVKPAVGAFSVPGLAALDEEFGRVAEAVIPSVVSITPRRAAAPDPREELLRQFFGIEPQRREANTMGSGVIVSEQGHIVTNLHVIEGADEVYVTLGDGRREKAAVLGVDALSDLAVLKVDAPGLRPLAFADSEKVRVGQLVFAVGNPFGLQETITQGIISARERLFRSEATEFFQTDAPINPGNSGGPLVNIRGEIVGISRFIFSESGGSQGIGFCIPSNTVRRVLDQIVEHGRVLRPYLGVVLAANFDAATAAQLGLPDANGALVEMVFAGSPAEAAGLRQGDFIQKFDGQPVRNFNELRKRVAAAAIGKEVKLEILRDGRPLDVPVTIVEQPVVARGAALPAPQGRVVPQQPPAAPAPAPGAANALSGVSVQEITPVLIRRHNLPENIEGVVVRGVLPGAPAAGVLQPGDAIEQVNDTPVRSVQEFARAAATLGPGQRAMLLLSRGRVRSFEVVAP
jgi:serine protease Do